MFGFESNESLIFLDIEAESQQRKILQFSAIKIINNEIVDYFNIFSNPKTKISKHVLRLVKNNLDNINNGLSQKESANKIYQFLSNSTIVSYGKFDWIFLKEFLKNELNITIENKHFDLQEYWQLKNNFANGWSLTQLSNFLNIEVKNENLHDARYDTNLLYNIYKNLTSINKNYLEEKVFQFKMNRFKCLTTKHNRNKENITNINNIDKTNGFVIIEIKFKKNEKEKIKILDELNILEIQNNAIKRNWSYINEINLYENTNNEIDKEEQLINILKKFLIVIRNKFLLIKEQDFNKIIELANLCSEKINVFPLNKIYFYNGFEKYFDAINFDAYKFDQNLNLIKIWLVFEYLKNR